MFRVIIFFLRVNFITDNEILKAHTVARQLTVDSSLLAVYRRLLIVDKQ